MKRLIVTKLPNKPKKKKKNIEHRKFSAHTDRAERHPNTLIRFSGEALDQFVALLIRVLSLELLGNVLKQDRREVICSLLCNMALRRAWATLMFKKKVLSAEVSKLSYVCGL